MEQINHVDYAPRNKVIDEIANAARAQKLWIYFPKENFLISPDDLEGKKQTQITIEELRKLELQDPVKAIEDAERRITGMEIKLRHFQKKVLEYFMGVEPKYTPNKKSWKIPPASGK